jgi:hypothetical protein
VVEVPDMGAVRVSSDDKPVVVLGPVNVVKVVRV